MAPRWLGVGETGEDGRTNSVSQLAQAGLRSRSWTTRREYKIQFPLSDDRFAGGSWRELKRTSRCLKVLKSNSGDKHETSEGDYPQILRPPSVSYPETSREIAETSSQ